MSQFRLQQLRHCQVGGATDFEVLWCNNNSTNNAQPSILKRTKGDFIDYGMPPVSSSISTSAIPHTKKLPIKIMFGQISFSTNYFKSGTGIKTLSISELIKVFGLSPRINRINLTFKSFPTVPVQILNTLYDPYHRTNRETPKEPDNTSWTNISPQEHVDYFPTLKCVLPPDWKL